VPSHVQTQFTTASSVTSVSLVMTATAGNAVIASLLLYFTNGGVTNTGGSLTQTFTAEPAGGLIFYQFANYNVGAGSITYSFSWTSSNSVSLFLTEVSGLKTSAAFDTNSAGGTVSAGTSVVCGSATPAAANDFSIALLHLDGSVPNNSSETIDNSFTVPTNGDQNLSGNTLRCALAFKVISAAVNPTWSWTGSADAAAIQGLYLASAAVAFTPDEDFFIPQVFVPETHVSVW